MDETIFDITPVPPIINTSLTFNPLISDSILI